MKHENSIEYNLLKTIVFCLKIKIKNNSNSNFEFKMIITENFIGYPLFIVNHLDEIIRLYFPHTHTHIH